MPSPLNTPHIDAYIMATDLASSKLPSQEVEEFRSDVNRLLKQQQQQHNKHCNLNPAQCRALTQLKQDNTRVVLTADKGVGHGHYRSTRLQQQSPGTSTRHQHLQSSSQGPYPPTQKQTHHLT